MHIHEMRISESVSLNIHEWFVTVLEAAVDHF